MNKRRFNNFKIFRFTNDQISKILEIKEFYVRNSAASVIRFCIEKVYRNINNNNNKEVM